MLIFVLNLRPEKNLSPQFSFVNEEFKFFANEKVELEKVFCRVLSFLSANIAIVMVRKKI